jgi:hypothetical protein
MILGRPVIYGSGVFTVVRNEGRIIEATIASPLVARDVDGVIQGVRMNILAQSEKAICVADLTKLDGLPPDAVDAFVGMFTRDNPRVERSALLLRRSPNQLAIQLGRMIRAAKSPSRMAFEDADDLAAWLDDVLRPAEKARLRTFLLEVG